MPTSSEKEPIAMKIMVGVIILLIGVYVNGAKTSSDSITALKITSTESTGEIKLAIQETLSEVKLLRTEFQHEKDINAKYREKVDSMEKANLKKGRGQ